MAIKDFKINENIISLAILTTYMTASATGMPFPERASARIPARTINKDVKLDSGLISTKYVDINESKFKTDAIKSFAQQIINESIEMDREFRQVVEDEFWNLI